MTTATAQAYPNIAFIKYWGNRDNALRIPSNGSISMNLGGLFTRTSVSFQPSLPYDELIINGHEIPGKGLERISYILNLVRGMAGIPHKAEVVSENNFPSGADIASSAAAFAALALANHAEGVGLLRTEFLYLDANQPPSEEQQFQAYREIFKIIGNRPIIVRTLDMGGDKPPSFMSFPKEMNPFLGWRAIRISLDELSMFKTQLRAILRAAEGYPARIMFPMISSLDELRRAKQCVLEAKAELEAEGLPFADQVPIGIMVETPAAALLVDALAQECDFFSLGTNDLTQYTLAVDRGNASVASLYQPLHPAVLRLIKQAIDLAHQNNKWIGMCGELAGMKKAIPILLGFGLDEFSMSPKSIPEAKYLISRLTDQGARDIALEAIQKRTTEEVESYMKEVLLSFK